MNQNSAHEHQHIRVEDARAHWVLAQRFLWLTDIEAASEFRLYHSAEAGLEQVTPAFLEQARWVPLQPASVDPQLFSESPHFQEFSGLSVKLAHDQIKALLKEQLIAVALDAEGGLLDATQVQTARVLDDIYTGDDAGADRARLGVTYGGDEITASVWAPTAQALSIKVFDQDKQLLASHPMHEDEVTGVWSYTGAKADLDRRFYRYEIKVYHPHSCAIETLEATDPYSVALSSNGRHTQFVNLDDADLKPEGWDKHKVPELGAPEDAVIYETHIRDFSILDESTRPEYRGKYLAFTETDSRPVRHLQKLQQAGLTHVHLLPANDIATIKETPEERVDITDTVGRLCELNPEAPVCGVEDEETRLLEVLQSYAPGTPDAQALVESMRALDGFNWGYDPRHYAAPEGSYASNPDGPARIYEMRAMIQALHKLGLRVALDVVFNHTVASALDENSVLDKLVPGYYHRLSEDSGEMESSTCCENTATEHKMMAKLMNEALVSFAGQFGFDAFRFDLMGHIPRAAILEAREAVRAVDPDTYFYGEGWNFGEVVDDRRFEQASQLNMGGTGVGTYSDRQRDAVRSGALFVADGSLDDQDVARIGLAGNIKSHEFVTANDHRVRAEDYIWNGQPAGYAEHPADTINYVSKHDNETLWDKLQYNLPADWSADQRVRVHNQALAMPLLSQGIPFVHLGCDMLRSKSMDRNSYDSGDWFNRVDFTFQSNNWNLGLPRAGDNEDNWPVIGEISANPNIPVNAGQIEFASQVFREFLQIRKSSRLFRLTDGEQVRERVKFHNVGSAQVQGLIVMSLDDGQGLPDLDPERDALVVVINATESDQSYFIEGAEGFELHPVQRGSVDPALAQAGFEEGHFTVPSRTTAVFVKPQQGEQGPGL